MVVLVLRLNPTAAGYLQAFFLAPAPTAARRSSGAASASGGAAGLHDRRRGLTGVTANAKRNSGGAGGGAVKKKKVVKDRLEEVGKVCGQTIKTQMPHFFCLHPRPPPDECSSVVRLPARVLFVWCFCFLQGARPPALAPTYYRIGDRVYFPGGTVCVPIPSSPLHISACRKCRRIRRHS